MKTDRELLELAAKAAGITLIPMEVKNVKHAGDDKFIGYMTKHSEWSSGWFSPLTDDGDALRLAVKLGISLEIDSIHCDDPQVAAIAYGDVLYRAYFESDPYAATRRAIVRAAATIGESMP